MTRLFCAVNTICADVLAEQGDIVLSTTWVEISIALTRTTAHLFGSDIHAKYNIDIT